MSSSTYSQYRKRTRSELSRLPTEVRFAHSLSMSLGNNFLSIASEDQISFRHHVYKKGNEGPKDIELEVLILYHSTLVTSF
jgi:hypothetical protein